MTKTIDTFELLQCASCKKNLEDFVKIANIEDKDLIEVLKNYSVFMELRRLREKTVNPFEHSGRITIPSTGNIWNQPHRSPTPFHNDILNPNDLTIT